MSNFINTQFNYVGSFKIDRNKYEVFEDISSQNQLINIFYKGKEDVECYSFKKYNITTANGKDLISKTKNSFIKLLNSSPYMMKILEKEVHLQVFPLGFWEDVIVPLKNGDNSNFKIKKSL